MAISVTIVAPGNMGAAIGRRLADNGVRVLTSVAGRSAATARRAEAAGMHAVDDEALVQSDLILSIVPPADAIAFAERMAPDLAAAAAKPAFVDCNAISPETVARIAEIILPTGAPFIDGGIIGAPPQPGAKGPVLYVSGEPAARALVLRAHGLDVRVVEGGVGAASALKMSYAGITKGLTALGAAMMLGATRSGVAETLYAELAASQPALLPWFTRQIPGMYQKAYRWVAEMEEIADFLRDDPAAAEMFRGAARLYERLAGDGSGSTQETAELSRFLDQSQVRKAS
jgi:3-hydroxyisobutyrate dehydrogenase-like beta-hydroxyacid dehydrogenase